MNESEKRIISQYAETIIIKANKIRSRHDVNQENEPHKETKKLISDICTIATTMQSIMNIDQKL